MTNRHTTLDDALVCVVTATTTDECVAQIEDCARVVFGDVVPKITVGNGVSPEAGEIVLRARGRVVGVLSVGSGAQHATLDERELKTFATYAALALDNVLLLEASERRAKRDPLTGLLNRGAFHDCLASGVAEANANPDRPLSLVMFDLDHFKQINDEVGHAAGDMLLRGTATALTSACRSDDAAFRIGGDEFALVLLGTSHDDASAIALRSVEAVDRLAGSAGISWGVATTSGYTNTRAGLVAAADAAMYQRKGRVATPDHHRRHAAARRLEVAARLASKLNDAHSPAVIARVVSDDLHSAFGYYLSAVHQLEGDHLRALAAAGELAGGERDFVAWLQPVTEGVNGRAVRTGTQMLVNDTRKDPNYLRVNGDADPGSELSTPITVAGRIWGVLNLEQIATYGFDEHDVMLANVVVCQAGAALERCLFVNELEQTFSVFLRMLCDKLSIDDPGAAKGIDEVITLATSVADELGQPGDDRRALRHSAMLRDIGETGVPAKLLAEPPPRVTEDREVR